MTQGAITELELANIIVDVLDLEDIEPEEIEPKAALFGSQDPNGLGLDSIDALEIALAIAQNYNIQLKADDENNHAIFNSLSSLTEYINAHR
ncbi:phosphopantetheine-binding protein [Marinibactrum halimedae]|uniref:Acyl carrier protein n=1 Tax=Marinibactrum halimedae TaxID=1444977 RepID=A0AA37WNC2_9GAMM|nr:phosphopantetheine-binding protein [Marinibactrum halimedae]MCD9460431.1 phosphopantetheine-binding protein [Marinibactrum halimedae]GLS27438.1 acyl carrier protein [Marinibactrum halimedae]